MLILSADEIRRIYTMKDCLEDVEQAFRFYEEGKTVTPMRTSIDHPLMGANTLYMPAYIEPIHYTAVKVVSIFPQNAEKGKNVLQGILLLTETSSGEHVAVMDASYLTVLRTGAVSGVATKYLARKDSEICTVIGCGAQAVGQIQAMMEVRSLSAILLYNRTPGKAEELQKTIRKMYPNWKGTIEIAPDANSAVHAADIVICSTRSSTPVFDGSYLKKGTHINGIGSYQPHMQEVDLTTLNRSDKIVADTKEGVLHEAGDFLIPVREGTWSFDRLYGELGEIVTGKKKGREHPNEITFCKSVGSAFLDTMVASRIYQKAKQLGIGTEVNFRPLIQTKR
jgi:ornithine cyclodeaminase/alanine dehydrogenase-like protein (mu-crystallin family)